MMEGHLISYGTAKTIEFAVFFGLIFAVGFYQLYDLKRLARRREQARRDAETRGDEPSTQGEHIPGWMLRR